MRLSTNVTTTNNICQLDVTSILAGARVRLVEQGDTDVLKMLDFVAEHAEEVANAAEVYLQDAMLANAARRRDCAALVALFREIDVAWETTAILQAA